MSGTLPSISDEDLHKFVDGELDPARKKAMLSRLSTSPADAARAEAWRRQNDALRAAFAENPAAPTQPSLASRSQSARADVSPSISAAGTSQARSRCFPFHFASLPGIGVAFIAGLATAFTASLLAERFDNGTLFRFDRQSRASITRGSDEPFVDRTLRASGHFESVPAGPGTDPAQFVDLVIVPNLSDAGLRLEGIRTAPGAPNQPFCLLYSTASDVEVTLCIDTRRTETEPTLRNDGDLSQGVISWRHKGARYSLAGALTDRDLGVLADHARKEIAKFASR